METFNTEQVSAGIGGLEFKNFVTSQTETGYKIHFTIINNNDASYSYKKKYYIRVISGETGSGKSLLANHLVQKYIRKNIKIDKLNRKFLYLHIFDISFL